MIKKLPLHSFATYHVDMDVEVVNLLIDSLTPSLQHLMIHHRSMNVLYRAYSSSKPPSTPSLPLWVRSRPVMIVRDYFPSLVSFRIDLSSWSYKLAPSVFSEVEFLAGLPVSLTTFSAPGFLFDKLDTWKALPPHITSIGSCRHVITAKHKQIETLAQINSFNLREAHGEQKDVPLDKIHLYDHWYSSPMDAFCLSKNLSVLGVSCNTEKLALVLDLIASSGMHNLLKLTLYSERSVFHSVAELFGFIPRSVATLILKIGLNCHEVSGKPDLSRALPAVKKFVVDLTCDDDTVLGLYSHLIMMLPSTERFETGSVYHPSLGLSVEHLKLFEGRLESLYAPLAAECLPDGEGPYPLATLLPKLRSLRLHATKWPHVTGSNRDYNFAAIPPHLKTFSSRLGDMSTEYLHLLEPGLPTDWRLLFVYHSAPPEMHFVERRIGPESSAPLKSETSQESNTTTPIGNERTLTVMQSTKYFRLKNIFAPSVTNDDSVGSPSSQDASKDGDIVLKQSWFSSDKVMLPGGLTNFCISNATLDQNELLASASTLVKLDIKETTLSDDGKLSLAPFTALRDLAIELPLLLPGPLPPSLTRFISHQRTTLAVFESFLPLPSSLVSVGCQTAKSVFNNLNLEILDLHGSPGFDRLVTMKDLPLTLKELTCDVGWLHEWTQEETVRDLFGHPSLTRIKVKRDISLAMAEILLLAPSHIHVEAESCAVSEFLEEPATLAHRAGFALGTLSSHYPKELFPRCLIDLLPRAYGSILAETALTKLRRQRVIFSAKQAIDWASFLPYLEPTTEELRLHSFRVAMETKEALNWPPHLTSLFIHKLQCDLDQSTLPPTIKTLVIKKVDSAATVSFRSLPKSLTHFECLSLKIESIVTWPPQLTHLATWIASSQLKSNIRGLPRSLEHLVLHETMLSTELFEALPSGLKVFEGEVASAEKFAMFAKKRGITWVLSFDGLQKTYPTVRFAPLLDALFEARRGIAQ